VSSFSSEVARDWLGESNLVILKIIHRVVVLKKLCAEDPVFVAWLTSEAIEVPRAEKYCIFLVFRWILHVRLFGHEDFDTVASMGLEEKFDSGQLIQHGFITLAWPNWYGILALEAFFRYQPHKFNEWLFWCHSQAHAIIKNYGLTRSRCKLSWRAKVNLETVYRPIIRIRWHVHPLELLSVLCPAVEVVAAESDVSRRSTIITEVDAEHLLEIGIVILVCAKLCYKANNLFF